MFIEEQVNTKEKQNKKTTHLFIDGVLFTYLFFVLNK